MLAMSGPLLTRGQGPGRLDGLPVYVVGELAQVQPNLVEQQRQRERRVLARQAGRPRSGIAL